MDDEGSAETGGRAYLRNERFRPVSDRATTGLPADLLNRAATRLRALALLYAFTFFMAGFFPALVVPAHRPMVFARPINWLPGVASIGLGLAIAWIVRAVRLQPRSFVAVALTFEIASSYGIAAAEFLQPLDVGRSWIGLSWVAVWTLLFNVVVPTLPRYAVLAALASVSAVPVMVVTSSRVFGPEFSLIPSFGGLFFAFIFPYLLVVTMAYVGARVVYALGREVSRARELGSYRLVERLGAGGMGEVWKADHRLLARPAAIKLIRSPSGTAPGMASDDMHRRFEREAQVIARLRSPHTVTLFDFGVADDGAFYYVMELLEGLDTERLVRRFGPMPAERVVWILRQVCHSLSEAQSCGLVHRDIKPANIFLCRYGEDFDFVKVLDFGIAKAIADSPVAQTQTNLTLANIIQGTPAFIAPEQALGNTEIDARADIYSTGCVAYWLLTGALVFTADTPLKLLMAHAHSTPERPSAKSELPIPPQLDALVMSCLEKNRDNRPASARALLERLDAIGLQNPWTPDRARDWWKTHLPTNPPSR
jgi:serine/threonine-protein kinase